MPAFFVADDIALATSRLYLGGIHCLYRAFYDCVNT